MGRYYRPFLPTTGDRPGVRTDSSCSAVPRFDRRTGPAFGPSEEETMARSISRSSRRSPPSSWRAPRSRLRSAPRSSDRPGLRLQGLRGGRRRVARDDPGAPEAHLPEARRSRLGRAPREPPRAVAQDARQGRADRAAPGHPRAAAAACDRGLCCHRPAGRSPGRAGPFRHWRHARLSHAPPATGCGRGRAMRSGYRSRDSNAARASLDARGDLRGREAVLLRERLLRRARAEAIDPEHEAVPADVSPPLDPARRLEGDGRQRRRQHLVLPRLRLCLEAREARHRHEPAAEVLRGEELERGLRERHPEPVAMIENRAPSGAATTYPPRSVASGSNPPSRLTGAIFCRERTSAVGLSRRPSACAQATAVSCRRRGGRRGGSGSRAAR